MFMHPENFNFNPSVSTHPDFLIDWDNITSSVLNEGSAAEEFSRPIYIEHYVNGKKLACPMPLLKLKMALKTTQVGNWVYVTATDVNSTQDIGAFCRHLGYEFISVLTGEDIKVVHILVQKTR